jgi:mannose-6-phosphate isomerase-like protein (cupin superfamily)
MKKALFYVLGTAFILAPAAMLAQSKPTGATYITDEEVKAVNALPGIDRTIKVVDIGPENFAVGVIHRAAPAAEPCGEQITAPPTGGTPGMIAHDQQTEGYLIISGSGTLVTGGKIVNGRKSPPESEVTKVLNGPSCSGMAVGADMVKKVVKTGDIIIIPANVPHGWTDITDHVDYLSFRPSARVLEAGYTNPALKK